MKFLEPMIIAFSMYSKIPMPRIEWNKENMKYTMCFFPLIGVVTGAIIYLAGMFLDGNIFSKVHSGRLMFAAVMTLIPVFVSGGIHLDGFMDTMDALGSWGDKEKKLEILKDSHNGAFAVIGICCYFTVSLGVWSEIRTEMIPVVAAGYVISRALSGIAVVTFPAARGSGLVKTFQDGGTEKGSKDHNDRIPDPGGSIFVFLFAGWYGGTSYNCRSSIWILLPDEQETVWRRYRGSGGILSADL